MSIFGKKEIPKPVEPQEESKPKFKPFTADDRKAMSLEAKYEVEVTLRDGDKIQVTRDIYAGPRLNELALYFVHHEIKYYPATEDDLLRNLRAHLKDIGKEGLFLTAEDVDKADKTSQFEAGQYIPPANIVGLAYRKVEEA